MLSRRILPVFRHAWRHAAESRGSKLHNSTTIARGRFYEVNVTATWNRASSRPFFTAPTVLKKKRASIEEDLAALEEELEIEDAFSEKDFDSASSQTTDTSKPESEPKFASLYESLMEKTDPSRGEHELPRHTALNHLVRYHVQHPGEIEKLPDLIAQWRKKLLPIGRTTTEILIRKACRLGKPEVAFTMLADRFTYNLDPAQVDIRRLMRAFIKKQSEETFDKAFQTYLIGQYYGLYSNNVDPSAYAMLISESLKSHAYLGEEEAWRRAKITADEFFSLLETEDKLVGAIQDSCKTEKEKDYARLHVMHCVNQVLKACEKHGEDELKMRAEEFKGRWERAFASASGNL
ncbi:uncharacterized protein VTP21DRAFT_7683 [Calcarisporiella thermophila]|uniref:uncharacterized protein n=1 Tax=Calcarisporiella thermophila TaxID=911321 RepID=UPI0037423DDC